MQRKLAKVVPSLGTRMQRYYGDEYVTYDNDKHKDGVPSGGVHFGFRASPWGAAETAVVLDLARSRVVVEIEDKAGPGVAIM